MGTKVETPPPPWLNVVPIPSHRDHRKNPTIAPPLLFPPLPPQQRLYHRETPRKPTPAPPLCLASRRFLSPHPHRPLSQILLCHLLFPVLAMGCKSSMFRGMMALKPL
ncbi:uncharacterized protein LOC123221065 [Mangifera indica]|uniref:uncharacterized protein LOC123221065 n=1 Tax=Mangifera indica TaxID=29780 RepID=UPI001CFA88F5|nr:uncharacterized protein LOC123221065 [Mangifera indica]